ncbi:hypothetical protein BDY19DRAFT_478466 [Irpex rosettiformis]|uniref:Uncharacterized protein n=1 Tax=Irpex rosettiformis TaxID=378272 RepID=A0ACB8TS40_9APHY|nr:hypothetical protein BDY19DRAFT_478466 [Irpex rosettiformis]
MPPSPIRLIPKISRLERPPPAITAILKLRTSRPPAISYRPAHHHCFPFGTSSLAVASHAVQWNAMNGHRPAPKGYSFPGVRGGGAQSMLPALKRFPTRDLRHIISFRHRSTISGMCHAPSIFAPTVPSSAQLFFSNLLALGVALRLQARCLISLEVGHNSGRCYQVHQIVPE